MKKVKLSPSSIKKALSKYSYSQAVAEYIWNGFDAQASEVNVTISANSIGTISKIQISDNGYGVSEPSKFEPIFESEKALDPKGPRKTSAVHGKNSVGRLTFFTFSDHATWETVYTEKNTQQNYAQEIEVFSETIDTWKASERNKCDQATGTTVTFKNIPKITQQNFENDIYDFLCLEFAWFLELHSQEEYCIRINGKKLHYSSVVIDKQEAVQHIIEEWVFKIRFIQWKEKLNKEYSRYYFIDSKGSENFTDTTKFNNKGDGFYHSIYISSSFFDEQDGCGLYRNGLFKNTAEGKIFSELIELVNGLLRKRRKPFLKEASNELVKKFEKKGILPSFGGNLWDSQRKDYLEDTIKDIYQVEPKIFKDLNTTQKKTFVRFLNLIIDSGERDGLIKIIEEVTSLDASERASLVKSLSVSKLSNIIKTMKLLEDRFKVIEDLRRVVFEIEDSKEIHIQRIVESHYWIFGEQYNLVTAEEPKFEEALRRYTYHLKGEKKPVKIVHPDKLKEMDIFMVRKSISTDSISNIVVELKHPSVALGDKELLQVKKYMRVILSQPEFNGSNREWTFLLIGNKFDSTGSIEGELETNKSHGEKHLVFKNSQYKIFVMTWSEIFAEFEIKHKYLYEQLEIKRSLFIRKETSAEQVVKVAQQSSAIQPSEIVVPK